LVQAHSDFENFPVVASISIEATPTINFKHLLWVLQKTKFIFWE
jgi:hypothetical protein